MIKNFKSHDMIWDREQLFKEGLCCSWVHGGTYGLFLSEMVFIHRNAISGRCIEKLVVY